MIKKSCTLGEPCFKVGGNKADRAIKKTVFQDMRPQGKVVQLRIQVSLESLVSRQQTTRLIVQ